MSESASLFDAVRQARLREIDRDFEGAIQVAADALLAEGISAAEAVEWLSANVAESDYLGELCIEARDEGHSPQEDGYSSPRNPTDPVGNGPRPCESEVACLSYGCQGTRRDA